jgi:hypothetical protein
LQLIFYASLLLFTLDIVKYYSIALHLRHIDGGRDTERDGERERDGEKEGVLNLD